MNMLSTRLLIAASVLLAFVSADEVPKGCPLMSWDEVGFSPPEHADEVCDRAVQNDPERIESIRAALSRSVATGAARQLKDMQTWHCPEDGFGENDPQDAPVGPPSSWIFRNSATTPVVVSWVNPNKNNLEVSAFNSEIHPAHHDPKAIVQPGEWSTLAIYLGHVFHVRELVSVGGDLAPGRILVRHRTGPLPIKNRFGGLDLQCPVEALADTEPESPGEFDRTPFDYDRRCNSLFTAFVNRMHCPVDVYWAGIDGGFFTPDASGKNETVSGNRKNSCSNEEFKFHLGLNPAAGEDYFDKWDSPVAYEATYLSHKFVARLRHDKNVVVDEIVVDRTLIQDCPSKKRALASAENAVKDAVMTASNVHTKTDIAVEANGETHEIVVSDLETSVFSSTKNSTSTVASIARNATKTVKEPDSAEVAPETSSTPETNVLMTSVGN